MTVESGGTLTLNTVTGTAVAGSGTTAAVGLFNDGGTIQVTNSGFFGNGTASVGYGLQNAATGVTTSANQSTFSGTADGIVVSSGSVNAGASQVAGGATFAVGTTLTCAGAYSGAYLPLNANCQ